VTHPRVRPGFSGLLRRPAKVRTHRPDCGDPDDCRIVVLGTEPQIVCRLNKGRVHFVVVFNLTRFARDKYDHFARRSHLQSLGISLRSASLFEMLLREVATGARFQVALEASGALFV
jgi:hypothetical protein